MRRKLRGLRKWPTIVRRGLGLVLIVVIAYGAMYATNLYGAEASDIPDTSQERAVTAYVQDPAVAVEQATLPIEAATPGWGARLKAWSLSGIDETLEAQADALDADRATLEEELDQFEQERKDYSLQLAGEIFRRQHFDMLLLSFDACILKARNNDVSEAPE